MAFKPIEILINAKDNASSVFSGLQGKVAAVGAAIATYFGINAFTGIVRGAADLEQGMSRVQAATGATAEEMQALRKAAEDAGANTKFTSTEAAGALENLAKAGLNAGEAIEALPAVLQLAQAGDIGLAESSEMVTKAVMGMGLAFSDAGRVADVLALGANATNTSVTGLAQALSYAAPVAQSLGLSLESTVAIVGKFADAGIDASRAGTALNSILSQFSNPASKFRAELNAAGITTSNFEDALHQLAAAGPAGSKAINAVGQEAGPALRALLNQGMGALDDLTGKLRNAEGSAAATAATMQNNLNGAFNGLASAWDTVKNALGTPVLPVLKDGVDQLAGAFRAAVADGTVGKFGEAIATAFKTGIQFVREFLGTVDFTAVRARLQEFATSANETFTKVGEYATSAGNIVKAAYGVMSAGANAVLTAIYGIGTAFAETAAFIARAGIKINEQLQKIAIGDAKERIVAETAQMRVVLEGLGGVSEALGAKMRQSFIDASDGADLAREGWDGVTRAVNGADDAVQSWQKTVEAAKKEIADSNEEFRKSEALYRKQEEASAAAARATAEHAEKIRLLQEAYDGFIRAGNLNEAIITFDELTKAQRESAESAADAAKAAQASADAIAAAYEDLGIVTDQSLREVADRAKSNFDTLAKSGTASARELAAGFENAARKAIAANDGIAPTWVRAEASVRGYKIEVDAAGKSVLKSMREAKDATDDVNKSARGAAGGYREMAAAAAESAKKLKELYDRNRLGTFEESADAIEKARQNKSGNAAILQTDINQQIADRYGEEFIGNATAEAAFQRRLELNNYRKKYGNVQRSQQSLNEERNIARELERLEREIEAERQAMERGGRTPAGGGTAGGGGLGGSTAGGGSGGRGGNGGGISRGGPPTGMATSPTQVTINLEGRPRTLTTDAAGAQVLQDLLRELGTSRGTYQ